MSKKRPEMFNKKASKPKNKADQIMEALGVNENNFDEDILYDFGRLSKLIAQFESVHGWIDYYYFQQFVIFVNDATPLRYGCDACLCVRRANGRHLG